MRIPFTLIAWALIGVLITTDYAGAATVWSGYTKTFAKPDDTDPLLPQWQDQITNNVALTRPIFGGGLVNAEVESSYDRPTSPRGTEWAYAFNNPGKTIVASNWQNLSFAPWVDSFGGNSAGGPPGQVSNPAVLHLIEDDVYLDFKLTAWTIRAGGGFSYLRAEPLLSADFNGDSLVDGADLSAWKNGFGTGSLHSQGDADFDADVDGVDFLIWQRTLKPIAATAASSAHQSPVPEPASGLLTALAALGLASMQACRVCGMQRK